VNLTEAQDKMAMAESIRQQLISETDPAEIEQLEEDYALLFDEGRQAVHAAMREAR
jgi:hypothetical protein